MRRAGRISGWNDDKGYGFVVPHDGGERAFVHIRALQPGARRPVDGDLMSYAPTRDARGRVNATEVRFAGQRIERRRPAMAPAPSARLPRMGLGITALAAISLATPVFGLPMLLPVSYWLLGALSYLLYSFDKSAARRGGQRIAENTLHLFDLLGGWPGALVAQQRFRHKTVKASFQFLFWCSVVGNLGLAIWLLRSGTARWLTDALLGI